MPGRRRSDALLTTSEVARMLHVHINTARRWSNSGVLRSCRIGPRRDRRFRRDDILTLLAELRTPTRDPADDGSPASSPDGRAVVFISTRSGTPRLFLLPDTDATDPEDGIIELSSAAPPSPLFVPPGVPFVDGTPAFLSPRSIVFSRAPEGGPPQLFILGLGSARMALRQVTNARVTRFGASEPVLLGGETIVFTAGPGPPSEGATGPDRFAVYRIEAGGFNLSRITGREVQYSDFSRRLGNQ